MPLERLQRCRRRSEIEHSERDFFERLGELSSQCFAEETGYTVRIVAKDPATPSAKNDRAVSETGHCRENSTDSLLH